MPSFDNRTAPDVRAAAQAALRLLDTRIGGRYPSRATLAAAPPMTDDQAIDIAIRLGLDDPEALRHGHAMLKGGITREGIERLAADQATYAEGPDGEDMNDIYHPNPERS